MYILKANLDEAARKAAIEKVNGVLTSNGAKVNKVIEKGLQDFAYLIKDEAKGYYVIIKVVADEPALKEFKRLAKLNPEVLRLLITVDKE
jgi:small subunit ribosomal protein S6